jgi:hypothetical protein
VPFHGDEFALCAPATTRSDGAPAQLGATLVGQFEQPFNVAGLVLHTAISASLATHQCDGHRSRPFRWRSPCSTPEPAG